MIQRFKSAFILCLCFIFVYGANAAQDESGAPESGKPIKGHTPPSSAESDDDDNTTDGHPSLEELLGHRGRFVRATSGEMPPQVLAALFAHLLQQDEASGPQHPGVDPESEHPLFSGPEGRARAALLRQHGGEDGETSSPQEGTLREILSSLSGQPENAFLVIAVQADGSMIPGVAIPGGPHPRQPMPFPDAFPDLSSMMGSLKTHSSGSSSDNESGSENGGDGADQPE